MGLDWVVLSICTPLEAGSRVGGKEGEREGELKVKSPSLLDLPSDQAESGVAPWAGYDDLLGGPGGRAGVPKPADHACSPTDTT